MDLPKFTYVQDVHKFLDQIDKQIQDLEQRVKNQQRVQASFDLVAASEVAATVDAQIRIRSPRLNAHQLMLASITSSGVSGRKIMSALERFVITDIRPSRSPKVRQQKKVDVRLNKVVIPQVSKLKTQYGLAEDLYKQWQVLEATETQLQMQFRDSRDLPRALDGLQQLKTKVKDSLQEVFKFLNSVAQAHVPRAFQEYVVALAAELSDHVVFRDSKTFLYVHASDSGSLVFSAYIMLEDALSESGSIAPTLYVTIQWNQGSVGEEPYLKLWLTNEFELPQDLIRRGDGHSVSNVASATRVLGQLLDLENFSSSIGTIPLSLQLKIDPQTITKRNFSFRDYIQSVSVDHARQVLRVTFSRAKGVDKNSVQQMARVLYPEVKEMFKDSRTRRIRMKPLRENDNWHIDFTVTEWAKSGQMTLQDVEWMKDKFGVTDQQLRRIAQLMTDAGA